MRAALEQMQPCKMNHVSTASLCSCPICGLRLRITGHLATPAANGPGEAGWLPIESAPKDGTDVLIWCAPWSCGSEARYIEDEGWWLANNHPADYWGDQKYPTHWQPLPAPPGTSASTPQPGMVTVPREPTQAMLDAGDDLLDDTVECARNVWRAMLDAALRSGDRGGCNR